MSLLALENTNQPPDRLEHASRYLTLTAFVITLFALLAALLLALQWRQLPFPGFLLDPNLVINRRTQADWPGRNTGMSAGDQIVRFGGITVSDNGDYRSALLAQSDQTSILIFTRSPDGSVEIFPDVRLIHFPARDFVTLFWLPYLVGVAYYAIALWIYGTSGETRPGRALAFFCVTVALATGLLFEILTTQWTHEIWIAAMSLLGGSLISLALRFPVEWQPVRHRPWILAIPYMISMLLATWGIWSLHQKDNLWLFAQTRLAAYGYITLGVIFFLIVTFIRARSSARANVRRQARLVLFGSLMAFSPVLIWFIATLTGFTITFNSGLLLPGLLIFPVAVATAIFRYRLLEIDSLINRAIVYGLLTATLAGAIAALIGLSQRLFIALTGERSDMAIVITTLFVVSAITPIKNQIQSWVDRQFREMPASDLRQFGQEVQAHIRMTNPQLLGDHLLEKAAHSLMAESAALFLDQDGELVLQHEVGGWRGAALVSVPIMKNGARVGLIQLGPRKNGRNYERYEVESLAVVSNQVAQILKRPEANQ